MTTSAPAAPLTIEFVNEVAPEHGRTSCSDERSSGNEYFNEFGIPRCVRCAFLYRLKNGEWPHKVRFRVTGLEVARDAWSPGAEGPWKCTGCKADHDASATKCPVCEEPGACSACKACHACQRHPHPWVRPDGDEELVDKNYWRRKP